MSHAHHRKATPDPNNPSHPLRPPPLRLHRPTASTLLRPAVLSSPSASTPPPARLLSPPQQKSMHHPSRHHQIETTLRLLNTSTPTHSPMSTKLTPPSSHHYNCIQPPLDSHRLGTAAPIHPPRQPPNRVNPRRPSSTTTPNYPLTASTQPTQLNPPLTAFNSMPRAPPQHRLHLTSKLHPTHHKPVQPHHLNTASRTPTSPPQPRLTISRSALKPVFVQDPAVRTACLRCIVGSDS